MNRFLRHIAVFSILVLVPLVCAEIYVERLPNPSRFKHEWMMRNSESLTTLVLGSSHTLYGINPGLLPGKAFSLAQISQTYRYDCWLLEHYDMPNLRTVILPFSYFSLYEDFENMPGQEYMAIRYRLYMDCDIHPRIGYYGFEFSSINALREKLKSIFRPPVMSWDENGWGTNFKYSMRADDWDDGERAVRNNTYSDTTLVSLNEGYLKEMAGFCREHDVKLVLVTTPVSSDFLAGQSGEQNVRNRRVLKNLLDCYPEILYLDYSGNNAFTDRDFYDSHHLNEFGAEKLTGFVESAISENEGKAVKPEMAER